MVKRLGEIVAEGLKEFADDLQEGKKISASYNLRKVVVDLQPSVYTADDVRAVRKLLDASQSVFAVLLGVTAKAVQKWEQGEQTPGTIASRFMDEIARDPAHFRNRLSESIQIREDQSVHPVAGTIRRSDAV